MESKCNLSVILQIFLACYLPTQRHRSQDEQDGGQEIPPPAWIVLALRCAATIVAGNHAGRDPVAALHHHTGAAAMSFETFHPGGFTRPSDATYEKENIPYNRWKKELIYRTRM